MKFFSNNKKESEIKFCKNCRHFCNDPALIENEFAGITILSSGYASVRNRDGICSYHKLYLPAEDSCNNFVHNTES